jgi:hypothetical protein
MLMSPSLPPWDSTNFSDCTNMPPEPQHGVVDAALVGGEHLDEQRTTQRGVELAAVLALGAGELGEEVLVDAAEQVLGAAGDVGRADREPMRSMSSPRRCLSRSGRP